jgi:hypothetical protein
MRARAAVLLLFAVLGVAPASAQHGPLGARVRVTTSAVPGERVVGRLAALTPDTLAVAVGGGAATLTLSTREVELLELSRGRPRLQWATTGATIGLVGCTVLGTVVGSVYGFVGGFVVGVVVGAPLGAGIGAFSAQERWTPYSIPREKW